ncbi:hypothetical protein KXW98_002419 [Aspergillus fumigatus]|nr:hypothetical protein KXX45_002192 [Aspergillus fumigatus]KAH1345982.1 hypothetical protein KXX33_002780 [Aspergillus fumigatus]KAH1375707.1 hypothetical protein KXX10_001567 [Aspergillus fumigatus]KAH1464091.1 hypothetical protein KXX53_002860 [Aspergillus fumigatus]KAH1495316.1 hypothetical protein KXX52_002428 [Aspergillus fumigatus]
MATAMQDVSPSFTSSPTSTMTTISTTTAATAAAAPKPDKPRKLRSACDACHRSKTRCSGGNPCTRCHEYMSPCTYSYSSRCGKPKGARSRKTLEREQRVAAAAESARIAGNPSALASLPATSTCTSTATAAATTTTKTTTTTTTIATTTAPSQGPAGDSAAAAAAATTSTVASPRADDCLGLFDDDEESNPFFSSGSENTGGTSFSPDWIPPLPSISDSDLSFPLLESCLGPDHDCNDSLFWSTTAEPDCQPTSKEPLDPRSKLLRSCKCLQTLSSLTARDIRRFDATFVFVRNYARAFSAFYHCSHCPKDAGSISMAVTALQLATTALEKTATAGTDAAGFKSGCSGMTAADLDEDLLTPGAELFLPANGRGASNPAFQLGSYQIAPLPGEPDLEEHSEILNILIRSAVRRLLAVCWQIWDLLRGPASRDGRGHVFEPYDPSSSSSSSSSSFSSGPEIHQLCDLSCSAEAAQFRSTLVQIPARLCNLLAL